MFATKRRFEPSVVQRLLDEPYRFEFFQAVRIVELWLKQNGIPHENAVADYVRFKNRTSLSFPASELEALKLQPASIKKTDVDMQAALQNGELGQIAYFKFRVLERFRPLCRHSNRISAVVKSDRPRVLSLRPGR